LNLWDQKAKTYPRYNKNLNSIQKQSFETLTKFNINFEDKFIIDIGCGTGVWSLHLAQKARKLLALDSSKNMLEILKNSAKELKCNNIEILNLSFESFCQKNDLYFDIAFLSMSGALVNQKDYENFIKLAKTKIYLGFISRKSNFLEPIFRHFNAEFKSFEKEDLENFLIRKKISFHKKIFTEQRIEQRTPIQALENALWHLNISGIKVDKTELKKLIKSDIKEYIDSKIKLLIFN